jgi:integrase/recombinase XerD
MGEISFEQYLGGLYPGKTVQTYLYSVTKFKAEHPHADNYGYQQIVDYFFKLKLKRLSGAYRQKILAAVKIYYEFLKWSGYRDDHPCRRFKINNDRLSGMYFEGLFTPDELQLLMQREERYPILEIKNKVVISLLIYQALTGEEITRIALNDIDLDSGTINVRASHKLGSRKLELHRTQIMLFARYINEVRPQLLKKNTGSLIINKVGNSDKVENFHALLQSMALLFPGKNLNPRQVRNSVIANWLNIQKIPLSDVQQMAGHKWPSTTEKYLRTDPGEKRDQVNRYHPLEQLNFEAQI